MGLRGVVVGMFYLVVEGAWWCFDGWKTLLDVLPRIHLYSTCTCIHCTMCIFVHHDGQNK